MMTGDDKRTAKNVDGLRAIPFAGKLAYRIYLLMMRREGMCWLPIRAWLVSKMIGGRSDQLNIFSDVFIEGFGGLRLGNNVSINRGSNISAAGGLIIGDDVAIGHATSIMTGNHGFSDCDTPIKNQLVSMEKVTIGNNVWIGARVTILAGVSLAAGTVVAAGAVVTRSVDEPDTIIGGIPARRLKSRFE